MRVFLYLFAAFEHFENSLFIVELLADEVAEADALAAASKVVRVWYISSAARCGVMGVLD